MNLFTLFLIESDLIECFLHASANVSNVCDSCGILTVEACGKLISACRAEFSSPPHYDVGLGRGPGPGS